MLVMLLASITIAGFQHVAAQATVSNVQFKQYDRYTASGTLVFANSSLGAVSFTATNSGASTYYLNIYLKDNTSRQVWMVENYPVTAGTVTDCQEVAVDYKYIGVSPGTPVTSVNYSYTITPSIVTSGVIVADHDTIKSTDELPGDWDTDGGIKNGRSLFNRTFNSLSIAVPAYNYTGVVKERLANETSASYTETQFISLISVRAAVNDTIHHPGVPGVEEDSAQCLPGAFARSIAWLNSQNNLGSNLTPKQIYDSLRKLFEGCDAQPNPYACRIERKGNFLKSLSNNRGTTKWEGIPANPCSFLKDKMKENCDMELDFEHPGGTPHIITVTGVIDLGNGCCLVKYRDDSDQGKEGGDKCEKTGKLCGTEFEYNGQKKKLRGFISECVAPAANRAAPDNLQGIVGEPVVLLQNKPNPFGSETNIGFRVTNVAAFRNAFLVVRDSYTQEVYRVRLNLREGDNTISYKPSSRLKGILYYSLELDGKTIDTKQMIFQNY